MYDQSRRFGGEMGKRILVVDDDMAFAVAVREGLMAQGYEVVACFDALGGGAALRSVKPAAMITDVTMPGGGGGALFQAARQDSALMKLPIVVVTATSRDEDVWTMLQAQPDQYTIVLHKPVGMQAIFESLDRLLSPRKWPPWTAAAWRLY